MARRRARASATLPSHRWPATQGRQPSGATACLHPGPPTLQTTDGVVPIGALAPRPIWFGLALACTLLVLASLVLTAWLDLSPCHLCIFQRLLFMLLALLAAGAALASGPDRISGRRSLARRLLGGLFGIVAATGVGVAAYQSWLQAQLKGAVSCTGGQPSLIERLVEWLGEQVPTLFLATGYCEDEALVILGLSLANWALVSFALFLAAAVWALRRDRRRELG